MAGWVAVLVDNKELVRFARLREGASGVLNLTTLLPRQDRVHVEIHLVNGRSTECVHTFQAAGVRRGDPRPRIVVSAHVRGTLRVSLRIDGELIETAGVDLPERMTDYRPWPLLALLLGIALIGALGWGVRQLVVRAAPEEPPVTRPLDAGLLPDYRPPRPDAISPPEGSGGEASGPVPEVVAPELPAAEAPVYFDPDRATLTGDARREIEAVADDLASWAADGGRIESVVILFEGHTALYGNEPGRLALSRDRAAAVETYLGDRLQQLGLDAFATRVVGLGANEPVTRAEDDQWRNRRVEISFADADR